jgi:hypothetical protein
MKLSTKSVMLTAAFSGLLTGTTGRLAAAPASGSNPALASAGLRGAIVQFAETEKHACQGKNSCKGKGGCKASDNGCKGKNSCKGKGGCATDGSKKNV